MTLQRRTADPRETFRPTPTHTDYATLPIEDGFDWARSLRGISFDSLYLVAFRSVRRRSADLALLKEHDDAAHDEALESGGLIYYFKGEANERRECLSFCLWESREHALRATTLPAHRAAADISAQMYESYELERYEVRRVPAIEGFAVEFGGMEVHPARRPRGFEAG